MITEEAKMPGAAVYKIHMEMHTSTLNKNISFSRESTKHLSDPSHKNGVMDQGKDRKTGQSTKVE